MYVTLWSPAVGIDSYHSPCFSLVEDRNLFTICRDSLREKISGDLVSLKRRNTFQEKRKMDKFKEKYCVFLLVCLAFSDRRKKERKKQVLAVAGKLCHSASAWFLSTELVAVPFTRFPHAKRSVDHLRKVQGRVWELRWFKNSNYVRFCRSLHVNVDRWIYNSTCAKRFSARTSGFVTIFSPTRLYTDLLQANSKHASCHGQEVN
ncbi:uncharacterized protein UMAG_05155 [Mycosarcoma maydis]|uniref:Uncharacterized protein n=1 Tax=Mycosarcoma maydis TaxID=5270 RepID=A0A0D1C9U5_MYCMD|nr:uncharacterized protein UMAG_05155 [Ustilago maydis 521]KIS70082.1 hypothetical protein UMAG_05155 [Ustilago maydis 521]|eukprot:XP_011388212.1 hypothetical protein UMAG_05155 [Ustilago maydis 521]